MATVYSLVCWGGSAGKSVTVSSSTDYVTLTNHGLRDATGVAFTSGTLPTVAGTALALNTTYYAKSISSSTFELYYDSSLTSKIDFTSTGSSLIMKSAYYLGLSDKSRWTTEGVERIYEGVKAWISGRAAASALDVEVGEVGEAFVDMVTSATTLSIPSGNNVLTSLVNGARSSAFPSGNFDAGYVIDAVATLGTGNILNVTRYNNVIDGIGFKCTASAGVAGLVRVDAAGAEIKNCTMMGFSTSIPTNGCIDVRGANSKALNNVILYGAAGINIPNYIYGPLIANNTISRAANGIKGSTSLYGFYYNNISVGNTVNYTGTTTLIEGASNNAGLSGEAWITGSNPRYTIATTDFANYANNDLRAAVVTSPQVEQGTAYYGAQSIDIAGVTSPAYPGSAYNTAVTAGSFVAGLSYTIASVGTTDFTLIGASANTVGVTFKATGTGSGTGTATLNAKIDIGAHEFDLGYGAWPTSDYYGLAFTGLVSGSFVKVFSTGTDTELFSTTSSGTSETWSVNSSSSATVDYVIQKAGYLPIRVTGITVTGGPDGIQSVPVEQDIARWYQASSGLTLDTNCFANPTTKKFGLTTASTLQNFASYLMEQWITLGDEGEVFANKPFPIKANGPNSFSWQSGWEADLTTYANTLANLSRDGMRYLDTSGNVTASWAAILSVGVSSGMRVRYQQTDGGTTVDAAVTSGNMDQLVQIYGDASHGNFDYTGHLVLKVQEQGYDQASADAVSLYGTLEDQLYVVGLTPAANGIAAANPTISDVTITDHGASPVTWNSKDFSITITDAGATSGTDILQAIRYAQETGGTFQGKDAFNWHDLVQVNGDKFKGVRGAIYGDTGATLKGVRVLRGSDAHPDFTIHMADDGTTVSTAAAGYQSVSITGLVTGSRVQIYDTTSSTELKNEVATGTSVSWVDSVLPVADRAIRVRIAYVSGATAKEFIEANIGTCGTAADALAVGYLASQVNDATYNSNAVDGSTVTGVTFTDSSVDKMNIDLSGGTIDLGSLYAAWVYYAFTATGIATDIDYIEAIDTANYVYSNLQWKNITSPVVPLKLTGGYAWDAVTLDPMDLIDTTGGTIFLAPPHVVAKTITVSGSDVITGDISTVLAAIPSASDNATAVWAHNIP